MNIKKVAIIGGGSAGWMVAAALSRRYPRERLAITLIESDSIGTVGVGESAIPSIRDFNKFLGINEMTFIRETKATFKLGIRFLNWGEQGGDYFHPFGSVGQDIAGIDFHHYWVKARSSDYVLPFDHYSLAAVAARQGKFHFPQPGCSLLSTYNYSYHFDAALYASYLRRYAEAGGVARREGIVNQVLRCSSGAISEITLMSGEKISADFFVDCTGFRAVLMRELGVEFESWQQWLRCDSAIVAPSEKFASITPQPYTKSTAKTVGWQWSIPLQHRVGNGYVYSSDYISHDEAVRLFSCGVDGRLLAEPRKINFTAGQFKNNWVKNCVAIGLAGGFLEPLESTSIYLIQYAIQKFIEYFPEYEDFSAREIEFNLQMNKEYARLRDFIIMHYKQVEREDSAFWRDCKSMNVPETLAERQSIFRGAGIVDHTQYGVYAAVCIGQGLIPKCYDIKANHLSEEQVRACLLEIQQKVMAGVQLMVNADEFITSVVDRE